MAKKRELNRRRVEKLGLDTCEEGIQDKLNKVRQLCSKYNVDMKNVAYIGDDINDLDVIKAVGFGCSVPNAIQEVRDNTIYVTKRQGGDGAVRDIIDLIRSGN